MQMNSMESQSKKEYILCIPAEIMALEGLSFTQKGILAEINALDNKNGCYASNAHFAERFDLSIDRVSEIISTLRKSGVISVEINKKEKNQRVIKIADLPAKTPIGENADRQKRLAPIGENAETLPAKTPRGLGENAEHIIHLNIQDIVQCNKGEQPAAVAEKTLAPKQKKATPTKMGGAAKITLPFASAEFAQRWEKYLQVRREKRWPCSESWYAPILYRMTSYEEGFVCELLASSTLNKYQGLFFPNTNTVYEQWKKARHLAATKQSVNLPFEGVQFELSWTWWKTHLQRLGKNYESEVQEQAILDTLQEFDEPFSLQLIKTSVLAGKWTLIWPDTHEQYEQYLKRKQPKGAGAMSQQQYEDLLFAGTKKPQTV